MELCLEEANYSRQPILEFLPPGCGFFCQVLHRPPLPPPPPHPSSFFPPVQFCAPEGPLNLSDPPSSTNEGDPCALSLPTSEAFQAPRCHLQPTPIPSLSFRWLPASPTSSIPSVTGHLFHNSGTWAAKVPLKSSADQRPPPPLHPGDHLLPPSPARTLRHQRCPLGGGRSTAVPPLPGRGSTCRALGGRRAAGCAGRGGGGAGGAREGPAEQRRRRRPQPAQPGSAPARSAQRRARTLPPPRSRAPGYQAATTTAAAAAAAAAGRTTQRAPAGMRARALARPHPRPPPARRALA